MQIITFISQIGNNFVRTPINDERDVHVYVTYVWKVCSKCMGISETWYV
jgi:hypothetical protein